MIYLNNAATTFPKPAKVISRVNEVLNTAPANSGVAMPEKNNKNIINDCRASVTGFFNGSENYSAVLNSGCTESLNMIIKGLDLQGTHVIATATEHNSIIRQLVTMRDEGGIELTFIPCDSTGYVDPDDIKKEIRSSTRLVCLNHCSNVTGTVQEAEVISSIVKSCGAYFLLDAAQSSGNVQIDIESVSPDFMTFSGHKSLYGLPGTGGFLLRNGISLKPLKQGATGALSDIVTQPDQFPYKYETGTMNTPGFAGLQAGISWIEDTGFDNILARKKSLVNRIIDAFEQDSRITLHNNKSRSSGALVSISVKGIDHAEINYILYHSFGITVRAGLHCAPLVREYIGAYPHGTIRISPSSFTKDEEIDKFITSFFMTLGSIA